MKIFKSLDKRNVLTGGVLNLFIFLLLFGFVGSSMAQTGCKTDFLMGRSYQECVPGVQWNNVCQNVSPVRDYRGNPTDLCNIHCTHEVYMPNRVYGLQGEPLAKARMMGLTSVVGLTSCPSTCSDYLIVKDFMSQSQGFACTEGEGITPGLEPCPDGQHREEGETECGCYQDYKDACLADSGAVFDDSACQCNCTLPRIYDLWVNLDCGNKVVSVYAWNGGENNSLYYPSGRLYRWVNNQELFIGDVSGSFSTANLAPGSYYIVYDDVNIYCSEHSYNWYINIEIDAACSGECILSGPSEEGTPVE